MFRRPTLECQGRRPLNLTLSPKGRGNYVIPLGGRRIITNQESLMPRPKFGAFLAPHHPIGEHPMLQFRRDLDLVEHLDKLGYDEFWCGEHHSSGWEMI